MKIKVNLRIFTFTMSVLAVSFLLIFTSLMGLKVSAARTISETVSILNPRQNIRGDGYVWMNIPEELTLTNIRIDTDDMYGLKICDGAVVILKGNNYIKASEAAIYCGGTVTFKGDGTLTLESDGVGILTLNEDGTDTVRIMDGSITIKAAEAGIKAEYSKISLIGGEVDISVSSPDGFALDAYDTSVNAGASLVADNTVRGTYKLNVSDASVKINAPKAAFMCNEDKYFTVANVELYTGNNAESLALSENYNGEPSVSTASTVVKRTPSLLFGDEYTVAFDIVLLICGVLLLGAVLVVPYLVKKRKTDRILADIKAREEAEMAKKDKNTKVKIKKETK